MSGKNKPDVKPGNERTPGTIGLDAAPTKDGGAIVGVKLTSTEIKYISENGDDEILVLVATIDTAARELCTLIGTRIANSVKMN